MMTENEAKTKWCPFAQVSYHRPDGDSPAHNRSTADGEDIDMAWLGIGALCIGSACMAWRWAVSPLDALAILKNANGERGGSYEKESGFCGLAK